MSFVLVCWQQIEIPTWISWVGRSTSDCDDNDDNDDDKQKTVVRFTDHWLEMGLISIDPRSSCYSTILHSEMKKIHFPRNQNLLKWWWWWYGLISFDSISSYHSTILHFEMKNTFTLQNLSDMKDVGVYEALFITLPIVFIVLVILLLIYSQNRRKVSFHSLLMKCDQMVSCDQYNIF